MLYLFINEYLFLKLIDLNDLNGTKLSGSILSYTEFLRLANSSGSFVNGKLSTKLSVL